MFTDSSCPEKYVIPNGFALGLEPQRIIGTKKTEDGLVFLIKWKGYDALHKVSSTEANQKCPQLVIKYYQKLIRWQGQPHKR